MALKSWLPIPKSSHFSLANIPFGIITTPSSKTPRPAIAIGDHALDLAVFSSKEGFSALPSIQSHLSVFSQPTLNAFAALGRPVHREVRNYLQSIFSEDTPNPQLLKSNSALQKEALFPLKDIQNHLPMQIGDYTDFFAGKNHAFNTGCIFRSPANALQPNYTHLPVAYHSRASSVVVSGSPVRRPLGQILENPAAEPKQPILSPCRRLDIELELGAFVCKANNMGDPIPVNEADESFFGMVLLNDWSARDIQAWEYVPLGPFNAKNFCTTISPWIVLMDALEPFRVPGIQNDSQLLSYLREARADNVFDIKLEVDITPDSGEATTVSRVSGKNLLYSFPQMLAHHTIGGCPMTVGDLLGSGTISGTEPGALGSFLELSQAGKQAIQLQGGEERKFLLDGDTITFRGHCGDNEDALVGFGECTGTIAPSPQNLDRKKR